MSTAAGVTRGVARAPYLPGAYVNRRYEHLFFSGLALAILAVVFYGFSRTYYLAGVFHAPLPNLLIHFHGAVFTGWILLLVTQTSLVSAGRVNIHRRLGIAGFALACLMVILGVLAATNALVRGITPPGMDAEAFYAVPLSDMLVFALLISFAFRMRRNPAVHKRLILIATSALTAAAFARWPMIFPNLRLAILLSYTFLVGLTGYDLLSLRRIHPATLWGGAFAIVATQLSLPIGHTAAWHAFATWAHPLGRLF